MILSDPSITAMNVLHCFWSAIISFHFQLFKEGHPSAQAGFQWAIHSKYDNTRSKLKKYYKLVLNNIAKNLS